MKLSFKLLLSGILLNSLAYSAFTEAAIITQPQEGASLVLEDGDIVNVEGASHAIKISKNGAGLQINGVAEINLLNAPAQGIGIHINSQATNQLGSGSTVHVQGGSQGIYSSGGGAIHADRLSVIVTGGGTGVTAVYGLRVTNNTTNLGANSSLKVTASGDSRAEGLNMNGGTLTATALSISATSEGKQGTDGMTIQKASADLGTGSKIITVAKSATTIVHHGILLGAGQLAAENLTVDSTGGALAFGIFASDGYGTNTLTLTESTVAVKEAETAYGIGLVTSEAVFNQGTVQVNGKENAYGIWLQGGTSFNSNGLDISVETENEAGDNAGIVVFTANGEEASTATLTGKIKIEADTAIGAANNGSTLNGIGTMELKGDIEAAGGKIDLTMLPGSSLTGASLLVGAGSEIKLDMSDSLWNMTADSQATTLALNNSQVNFETDLSDGTYGTLSLEKLSGNGTFRMRTDIAGEGYGVNNQGDLVVITENASGSHQLIVTNNGSAATNGTERLTIIETTVDDDEINRFTLTNQVDAGGYEYGLRRSLDAASDWELYGTGRVSTTGNTVNLHAGNYLLHNAELQTLLKRMGDLRNQGEESPKGGVWGRIYGGKLTSASDGLLKSFDLTYGGIQVGADRHYLRSDRRGSSYLGGFFGYTNGNLDYQGGSGDTDALSLGAYWSYLHRNGFYADAVLKYGRMKSDYDVVDSAGLHVEGKEVKSDVLSLSLELGRRYFFRDKDFSGVKIPFQERKGWYIEPQAQITLSHFEGDNFTASNGLSMKIDSFRSVIARIGTHVGYEVKKGKNPINVYAKGYWMKEFNGEINFRLNGSRESTSYEDTWFAYGMGVAAQLGDRHHLYLDLERWSGGRLEQKWMINGGYRYSW